MFVKKRTLLLAALVCLRGAAGAGTTQRDDAAQDGCTTLWVHVRDISYTPSPNGHVVSICYSIQRSAWRVCMAAMHHTLSSRLVLGHIPQDGGCQRERGGLYSFNTVLAAGGAVFES